MCPPSTSPLSQIPRFTTNVPNSSTSTSNRRSYKDYLQESGLRTNRYNTSRQALTPQPQHPVGLGTPSQMDPRTRSWRLCGPLTVLFSHSRLIHHDSIVASSVSQRSPRRCRFLHRCERVSPPLLLPASFFSPDAMSVCATGWNQIPSDWSGG